MRPGASGRPQWVGPVFMLFARSLFLVLAQGLVALLFLRHTPHPFQAAAKWWTVWATLADLACLFLLVRLTRREGLRLFDLMGPRTQTLNRDVFQALSLVPLLLVLDVGGVILGDYLVYGSWLPLGIPAGFAGRVLPLWAVVYSRLFWWPLWSWMEETTYNGYALPRLQALTGRSWIAVALVTFGWSFQHLFLPMLWDGRYFLWRFLVFIPFNLAAPLLYLRLRRLAPIVFAHWCLDLLTTLITIA